MTKYELELEDAEEFSNAYAFLVKARCEQGEAERDIRTLEQKIEVLKRVQSSAKTNAARYLEKLKKFEKEEATK